MCCDVCLQGKWRLQHQQALQSNELIDFNFRAVLSPPDVLKLSSIAEHKLVTVLLVQRRHTPTTAPPAPFSFTAPLLPARSVSLRQVAILEMLFLNVLKASVVRWMLSLRGCFLRGSEYTCPRQRWSQANEEPRTCECAGVGGLEGVTEDAE